MLEVPAPKAAALQPLKGAGDSGGPKPRHAPAAFELCSQACEGEEQIPILTVLFGFPGVTPSLPLLCVQMSGGYIPGTRYNALDNPDPVNLMLR